MNHHSFHLDEVQTRQDLLTFVRFPWEIYRGDPNWVPPLIKDQVFKLGPSHPFRLHSEMVLFLARNGGRVVGRAAAIIDHHFVDYHGEKTGFFGFFESVQDTQVPDLLFSGVREWLRQKGMERMVGPMNPSTNDECALLVDGFGEPPRLMMPYNPPYYPSLLEKTGLSKVIDLYTYWLEARSFQQERLARLTERLLRKEPELRIRAIDLNRFPEELRVVREIYNDAWSKNWGFVPITEAEIEQTAKELKPLVVPELVLFAYWGDDPVAFSVGLPDYNLVLKRLNGKVGLLGGLKFLYYSKKINTLRVLLLGVKRDFQKRGIEGLLYFETFKNGLKKGYHQAECSWILENNLLMQHGLEAMGAKRRKTYRIYGGPVSRG